MLSLLLNPKASEDEQKKVIKRQLDLCREMGEKLQQNVQELLHPALLKRCSAILLKC